jgi:hypothetical protein
MSERASGAAILVSLIALAAAGVQPAATAFAERELSKIEELWRHPDDIASRDLFYGPGGRALAPAPDAPFTWLATDTDGFSGGFDVRGRDGREWSVKLGPEAQTEVVTSRVLWAIGYHQPPTYHLAAWELSGGPGGRQGPSRFRTDFDGSEVVADWSWTDNPFMHTQAFRGLIVANIVLNSWDWKTSNNRISVRRWAGHRARSCCG